MDKIKAQEGRSPHEIIAIELMSKIMYSNGVVNRWNPAKYSEKWVKKIAPIAGIFFDKNPSVLTDEDLLNICDGEISENEQLYGRLDGYKGLSDVLNEYFDNL